jgi:hypothetical protein
VSATIALTACSSSYHPEYHPVTVSNFSQNISYAPGSPTWGAVPERPSTVVLAPLPPPPAVIVVPGAPAGEVPPEFFH